jgi:hypothetical protein
MRLCVALTGQRKFPDKAAYSHHIELRFVTPQHGFAEADERHSSLLRQNTGGSVALCLGAPAVPGYLQYLQMTIKANPG